MTLREAGLPHQAIQEFERILDAHPGLVESRVQLGLTCYAMGRTDEAIEAWKRVLAQDPTRREAHMYLRLVGEAIASHAALSGPPARPAATQVPGWSTRPLAAAHERAALPVPAPNGVRPQ